MNYQLLKHGVRRLGDGACIPDSPDNADWREYQRWLTLGNTPAAADLPAPAQKSALDLVIDYIASKSDAPDAIKAIAVANAQAAAAAIET